MSSDAPDLRIADADAAGSRATGPGAETPQPTLERIDDLIGQLERAAEQLRSGELSPDAAATVVEDCVALATEATGELERLSRAEPMPIVPGQDSLL